MLGVGFGRDHPGDLRQPVRLDVGRQDVEQTAAGADVGAGQGLLVERRARRGSAVLGEVGERVVAVVADQRIGRVAVALGGAEAGADVLVDLPAHSGGEQLFREGAPAVAVGRIVDDRAAVLAVVSDPAGPHVVAVRARRTEQRAVVGVADREGVGERVMERDVVARQVGHRRRALGGDPAVVLALVPGGVGAGPVVRQVLDEGEAEVRLVRPERQGVALRAAGLMEHRLARREGRGARIGEAAHPVQRPEIMIESPVLLHQDHDVLDIGDGAGGVVRRNGKRPADALRHHAGHGTGGEELEKAASIVLHVIRPRNRAGVSRST